VEVSHVRRRLKSAIDAAREQSRRRREEVAEAERAYENFITEIATPVARQLANALKVEGYAFTVSTPGTGLRLASDRSRDDVIEFGLDVSPKRPEVVATIRRQRGSRTIDQEVPVKRGAFPEEISEEDVLEFLLTALEPWLER
jgi:hypothetical protein